MLIDEINMSFTSVCQCKQKLFLDKKAVKMFYGMSLYVMIDYIDNDYIERIESLPKVLGRLRTIPYAIGKSKSDEPLKNIFEKFTAFAQSSLFNLVLVSHFEVILIQQKRHQSIAQTPRN